MPRAAGASRCIPTMSTRFGDSIARGVVRVTDAMLLPGVTLTPLREVARRVERLSGRVPMRWRVEPRFGYAGTPTRLEWRGRIPVATAGGHALAVCTWSAGNPKIEGGAISGRFRSARGMHALLVLARRAPGAAGLPWARSGRGSAG